MEKLKIKNIKTQSPIAHFNQTTCIGIQGPTGTAGNNGNAGLSAYQVAVENGFVGTENEWLNSLVGPIGPDGITQSIIPYYFYDKDIHFYSYGPYYQVFFPGFGAEEGSVMIEALNIPTSFDVLDQQTEFQYINAFCLPQDCVLTSISGEVFGGGEMTDNYFHLYMALYQSPANSSVFTRIDESIIQMQPMVNINTETFKTSGGKNFSYTLTAGTKLAMMVYMQPVEEGLEDNSVECHCSFTGSISLQS